MRMRWYVSFAFLVPALLVYGALVVFPALSGFWVSLTDFRGVGVANFVGLGNYRNIFEDSQALHAIRNSLIYTVLVVVIQNGLGLLFAVWLGSLPRIRNAVRVALFMPSMIAAIIVGFIWGYIYNPLNGPLNAALDALGLGFAKQIWLGDPNTALLAIVAVHVWMYLGHSTAIFLAGYLCIAQELLDSAAIDGASPWNRFRFIEWPLMAASTTIAVTLTTIGTLRIFDLPYVLTNGGPGDATEMFGTVIYRNAFTGYRFGYATALAVVMVLMILVISTIQNSFLRAREAQT